MRIEELSVGDWVKTTDKDFRGSRECTIQNIEKWRNNNYVLVVKFKDGSIETLGSNCFNPIPLTPEILEKNVIEKTYEGDEYVIYRGTNVTVTKYERSMFWEFESQRNRVTLEYLHQLQHALRLAGYQIDIML